MGYLSELPRPSGEFRLLALSRWRTPNGLGREDFQELRPLPRNAGNRGGRPGDPPGALSLTQPRRTSAGTENRTCGTRPIGAADCRLTRPSVAFAVAGDLLVACKQNV